MNSNLRLQIAKIRIPSFSTIIAIVVLTASLLLCSIIVENDKQEKNKRNAISKKLDDEYFVVGHKEKVVNRKIKITECAVYVFADNLPTIRVEKINVSSYCKYEK